MNLQGVKIISVLTGNARKVGEVGMKEYIIKVDEEKKDIMGNCPLVEKPQELVRCKDCKFFNDYFVECEKNNHTHGAAWFCADGEVKRDG